MHEGETKVVLFSMSPTIPTMTWEMFRKTVSSVQYFVRTFEVVEFSIYVEVDGFPGIMGRGNLSEFRLGSGVVNTS